MAIAHLVSAKIKVHCKMSMINEHDDPQNRPPREGKQWIFKFDVNTGTIAKDDWDLRVFVAYMLLQYGFDFFDD